MTSAIEEGDGFNQTGQIINKLHKRWGNLHWDFCTVFTMCSNKILLTKEKSKKKKILEFQTLN